MTRPWPTGIVSGDNRATNVIERLTQTEATALAYAIVTVAADGLTVGAAVFYTAELRKGADQLWRFSYMFIGMDAYNGTKPKVRSS